MTMRKYLVTVHKDGRISASEYDEPQGFVYCDREAAVEQAAYNRALRDVQLVLEAEKTRCEYHRRLRRSDIGWAARSLECEVLEAAIEKLFRKS